MRFNRVLFSVLVIVSLFGGSLSASAKQQMIFSGSQAGGTWFIMCGAVAQVVNKYLPEEIDASPSPSSGSFENARGIRDGAIDCALILPNVTDAAYKGEHPWIDEAYKGVRGMFNTYSFPYMFVTKSESEIKTILDAKGKRIATGPPGSSESAIFEGAVLPQYGLDVKDFHRMLPLSGGDRVNSIIDEQADLGLFLTSVTAPMMAELTTTCDVRFIPIEEDHLESISEKFSYFTKGVLKANTFRLQDIDIPSIIMWGQFCCDESMDEELVYKIVKTVFEHKEEVEEIMPLFKEVTLETATIGMSMPLHPGAARYFKEQGVNVN